MAELSRLFVTISSKFDPTGINDTIKKIDETNNRIKNISAGFKIAGAALTAFAAGGVALITNLTKSAMEQEKVEIELAEAMKTAGTYTKEAHKHNLDYASSLQKLTTFGDEAIITVQKMLTNFKIEGPMLDELTRVTLDLAAAKGMDLKAASDLVAKSVGSSTNALSRYGIVVEGDIGSTERMQMAVENISKLFGGAAQAQAMTFEGKLKQLGNRIGDIKEKIGMALMPTLENLLKIVEKTITWVEGWDKSTVNLIAKILLWTTAIAGVLGPLFLLIGYLPQIVVGMTQVISVIKIATVTMGGWITVIGLASAGIILLVEAYDKWADRSNKRQGDEAKELKTIEGKLDAQNKYIDTLKAEMRAYDGNLEKQEEIKKKLDSALRIREKLEQQMKKQEIQSEKTIKTELKNLNLLNRELIELTNNVYDFGITTQNIGQLFIASFIAMSNIAIDFTTKFQSLWWDMQNNIALAMETFMKSGMDTWTKFGELFTGIWQGIRDSIIRMISDIAAEWVVKTAIMKAATLAWATAEWIAHQLVIASKIIAGWSAIPFVGHAIGIGIAASVITAIASQFKKFAEGGMVLGKQLAMVGESGSEVVLPLTGERTTTALAQAITKAEAITNNNIGGTIINITVPSITSRRNAREMGEIIGTTFLRKIQKTRRI